MHDLEEHLRLNLSGGTAADPEAAVLLVRGALAGGDQVRAAVLAEETTTLAAGSPEDPDMAAAAAHVDGLVERDPDALEQAAGRYCAPLARAWATEDAGISWAERGNQATAVARLRQAHGLYEELGAADGAARVPGPAAGGGTPAAALEPGGPPRPGLGQPDRYRAPHRGAGGRGPQQPAGGRPDVPEQPPDRPPPAACVLEAGCQLPCSAGAAGRPAGAGRGGG